MVASRVRYVSMTSYRARPAGAGSLLRGWRERRRLSQLELASRAGVSARHVSFIETGRAQPSRAMIDRLGEQLEIPLRERNQVLVTAGYAPAYPQHGMNDEQMRPVRAALETLLAAHEPFPALVVDRNWYVVVANRAVGVLLDGVDPTLLAEPMNALRVTLHPQGMAPRIANLAQWREHLLSRLRREVAVTGDQESAELYRELLDYPVPGDEPTAVSAVVGELFVPLRLRHGANELSFFSTVTTFGTALDVTMAELSVESFFPADSTTAQVLRQLRG